jgi:sugar phosphate isomerase/epimerase
MRALGIERLCVFGMPPVEFIALARQLGCGFVGIGLAAMRYYNPHNYDDWSLRDNPALRRAVRTAALDSGVEIGLCEGFGIREGAEISDCQDDLDIVTEIGCPRINVVSVDRDRLRTFEQFSRLSELAHSRGLQVVTELGTGPVKTWADGLDTLRQVNQPNFRLLLDTMHFFRFGGTVTDVAAASQAAIGYVQLCDVPYQRACQTYMEEALYERRAPGDGDLPLLPLLQALPPDVPISLEVPQRSLAAAGVDPRERVGACVSAARKLLEKT